MKIRFKTGFVSLLLLILSPLASAEALVWKVSKNKNTVYIGGTIHMLSPADYPLPPIYEKAYQHADLVVFETDMAAMSKPETQLKMFGLLQYPPGESLKSNLKPETHAQLAEYLKSINIGIANFEGFKPSGVMISLLTLELGKIGVTPDSGVDNYFFKKAVQDKKESLAIESIDEQLTILANLGSGYEDAFISESVRSMRELPTEFKKVIDAWRSGDAKTLDKLISKDMRKDFPEMYDNILVKRNRNWVPEVEALSKTKEKEFILVGAAHLVGKDSLLAMLKKKGYKVKKLEAKDLK